MAKVKNKRNAALADKVHKKKNANANKKTLNPFEVHINKEKLKVLGKKSKHDRGLPGVSRAKAIQKRKETLGTEMKLMNKTNAFIDRRIGEKDNQLSAEDRMVARFAAERAKQHKKKSIYNLADDEILTHRGQTLEQIEKFDDPRSSDDEDEEKKFGGLDDDFVSEGHFGGGVLSKSDSKDGAKSHKDLIEQLIAESKKRKAEKQKEKEQTLDLTEKLDTEWKDLQPVVFKRQKVEEESLIDKLLSKTEKGQDYDKMMRELKFEKRGTPSDGLISKEKQEEEDRKKLDEFERLRQQRMFSEEEIATRKTVPTTKHRSADDLDDNFELDDDQQFMLAYDKDGKPLVPEHILKNYSVPNARKKFEDGISDSSNDEEGSDSEGGDDNEENQENDGESSSEDEDSSNGVVDNNQEDDSDSSNENTLSDKKITNDDVNVHKKKITESDSDETSDVVQTSKRKNKKENLNRINNASDNVKNAQTESDEDSESDETEFIETRISKEKKKQDNIKEKELNLVKTQKEKSLKPRKLSESDANDQKEFNEKQTTSDKYDNKKIKTCDKVIKYKLPKSDSSEDAKSNDEMELSEQQITRDKKKLDNKNVKEHPSLKRRNSDVLSESDDELVLGSNKKLKLDDFKPKRSLNDEDDSQSSEDEENSDIEKKKEINESDDDCSEEIVSMYDLNSTERANIKELLTGKSPSQQSDELSKLIKTHDPSLGERNKDLLSKLFAYLLQYVHDLFSNLKEEADIIKAFLIFDKLVPHFYDLIHINKVSTKKFILELLKEKHDNFIRKPKKVPDLDTLIFFKLVSVLYPTSDFRHPVTTPSLIFMSEILTLSRFRDQYSISRGFFIVALILEYTALSKRFVPSALNFLRGIFYLCANTSVLNPVQVVPPFRLHKDLKILNLERDCSAMAFDHKMTTKDLVTEIDESFKMRCLLTGTLMLKEFFDNYNDLEALDAIFESHIQLIGRVDLDLYPKKVAKNVSEIHQYMTQTLEVKTYTQMAREKVKPKALRLYEPDVQDVFTGSKSSKLSRETAERARLQGKYKKEMKGALREIRRDKAYIASVKIRQKIQSDNVRKEKVKQIFKDASIQQGELNKLKRMK